MATDGSASAASEIEVGSTYPTIQEELRAAAPKQADTYTLRCWCGVVRDVKGRGLPVPWRNSYRVHRVELWRIANWLKAETTKGSWKSSRVDNSSVPAGLYPAKTGELHFRPMAGLMLCVFYLILLCTVFCPQTDKVYLFSAATQTKILKSPSGQ